MSNLVAPMLTSVESSTALEFYPSSIRFVNSPCAIINKGSDKVCLNDTSDWNDLEHLVGRPSLFNTSTPIKSSNDTFNRRIFSNNCVSIDNVNKFQDYKQMVSDRSQGRDTSHIEHSKVINNIWNISNSENNSCSKACVNVNMGYNEGSSLESMVSNKKTKSKPDFIVTKTAIESNPSKLIDSSSAIATAKTTETNNSTIFLPQIPPPPPPTTTTTAINNNNNQVKTFKNGSKTGHSRQWGSCGSPGTLQLHFEDKLMTSKLSQELKQLSNLNKSFDITDLSPQKPTTEIRHKPNSQTNRLKRISQVSFEAEFDSEGRTHEQIAIDFRKIDPYTLAGQITQIELLYFKAIKSEEFLSFKWTGLTKYIHAPGIVASTRWFNQLNFWAQRIILECTELNRRSEMLIYLIRIIKKLVDCYNNLSSGMALMSALEVECIHRLKQTWNTLPNKDRATYRRLEELFASANNYEKLREHINSMKLPCIPYLGLYLTDLTYINVAHSKLSEFESQTKTDQMNNILRTVSEFQQSEYDVSQSPILYRYLESQRYIEELQKIIEENNYRTSLSLEPNVADTLAQQNRIQQDFPTFSAISPQKSPPSYACKHSQIQMCSLQSPISPRLVSSRHHNESIKELPEQQQQTENQQMPSYNGHNPETVIGDEYLGGGGGGGSGGGCGVAALGSEDMCVMNLSLTAASDISGYQEGTTTTAILEESMLSSRYSDDDSVKVSLLCGAGRKSHFKKRKSTSASIRFKRDSSSSSRQRMSSKTATLSSTSQSALSDKDVLGQQQQHSKSLLDDSYLDATVTDQCSGPGAIDEDGQPIKHGDNLVCSSKQSEQLCSPPICRCLIKGDVVDLKPKASSKCKTEYSNLVNIAHAAETAVQLSKREHFYHPCESDNDCDLLATESPSTDDRDVLKLVCQGVLSRKVLLKNTKRSLFSMWSRQWMVLILSRTNAFLVFFENCQFRALDRKDFKSKKCHVQDLKRVVVSRVRPSRDQSISEQRDDDCDSDNNDNDNDNDNNNDDNNNLNKFFLTDKEYGTVYKFHDPSNKSHKSTSSNNKDRPISSSSAVVVAVSSQMPSVTVWYQLLRHTIKRLTRPSEENKDLIVLGDS